MKIQLLLDANISWRSAAILKNYFDDCCHVDSVGLNFPAKDIEIWEYAKTHNLIIVTNDEDFLDFSMLKSFPPKIILLRVGNQSRKYIEQLLIFSKASIENFTQNNECGVLEII